MSAALTDHTFQVVMASYVLFANFFWLGVKAVLRSEGFPVSLLWHWNDLSYLHELVAREPNQRRRQRFRWLLISFYAMLVLFPLLILFFDLTVPVTRTI